MQTDPAIWMRSYDAVRRRHRHAFHQVVVPRTGTMEFETDAACCRAGPGCALLIPADAGHAFRGLDANRFTVIDLDAATAPDLFEPAREVPMVPVSPAVERHVETLEARSAAWTWSGPFRRLWAGLLLELLAEAPAVARGRSRFDRAAAYVHAHCSRPLSPREVAGAVHVSTAQLARIVHRATGVSTGQWIVRERLDRAARLLRTTDLGVGAIALECGFSEHSALTRAFRRVRGCTPADYRRRFRD